jgi:uncharacterized protein
VGYLRKWTCVWLVLLLPSVSWALDLYQGEVPVANQTADARIGALGKALLDVAVKVSGDASAGNNPTIISAQRTADKLMQRYEYRQELVRENGAPVVKLYLKGTFYPASVNALLQRAGFASWGTQRPTVAVYLFEGNTPISSDVMRAMSQRGAQRGVNVRFPGGVSASDAADAKALADRLGSSNTMVLAGVVGQSMWLSDGRNAESLSSAQLDGTTDRLASALIARVARTNNAAPETVLAGIVGIQSAADYSRAMTFLTKLSIVKKLTVQAAQQNTLMVNLSIQGGAERLRSALDGGKTMRALEADLVPDGITLELVAQ